MCERDRPGAPVRSRSWSIYLWNMAFVPHCPLNILSKFNLTKLIQLTPGGKISCPRHDSDAPGTFLKTLGEGSVDQARDRSGAKAFSEPGSDHSTLRLLFYR